MNQVPAKVVDENATVRTVTVMGNPVALADTPLLHGSDELVIDKS